MNRCDLISNNYKAICRICKSLTDDWEDLTHDLCEYFLTCKADILEINERGKFLLYVYGAARNHHSKYRIKDTIKIPLLIEEDKQDINTTDIISKLDAMDVKILSIFATGVTASEVSRRTGIDRHTIKKYYEEAQKNARKIIDDL